MNVWFIAIADFPEGRGITPRLRNMASGLVQRGVHVALKIPYAYGYVGAGMNSHVSGDHAGVSFEFINRSVERPSSETGVVLAKLGANLRLAIRLLFGSPPEAVIIYNYSFVDTGLIILAAKIRGVRVIFDVCDERFDVHATQWDRSFFRRINAWQSRLSDRVLFRFAEGFLCVSHYLREKIVIRGGRAPIQMIPLASILGEGDVPTAAQGIRPWSLAYLGSLIADEGIEVLFGALAIVSKDIPDVMLTVVGDANAPEYRQRLFDAVERLQIPDRVRFLGGKPAAEALAELKHHDILVLPRPDTVISRVGFPGKISEYCASLRPIVSTPFGDMPRYFEDGRDIYFADGYTEMEFAQALRRAFNDRSRLTDVGSAGFRTALALFGYDQVANQVHAFLRSIVRPDVLQPGGSSEWTQNDLDG